LKPYEFNKDKDETKIISQNPFMVTALKKIGERISGKVKQETKSDEKFVVYANINS
jgi:hypothetical protein